MEAKIACSNPAEVGKPFFHVLPYISLVGYTFICIEKIFIKHLYRLIFGHILRTCIIFIIKKKKLPIRKIENIKFFPLNCCGTGD